MHLSPYCPLLGHNSLVDDLLFIVTPNVGFCNHSMFCCTLLYIHSSFAIPLMGKRELVVLLSLSSSLCLLIIMWLFLAVAWVCLQFVIVVFPDLVHLLILSYATNILAISWAKHLTAL